VAVTGSGSRFFYWSRGQLLAASRQCILTPYSLEQPELILCVLQFGNSLLNVCIFIKFKMAISEKLQ